MKDISYLFNENRHFQSVGFSSLPESCKNNSFNILKSFFKKKNFKKVKELLEIKDCGLYPLSRSCNKYIIKVVILKSEKGKEFTITQEYVIDQKELNMFYNREDKFINILD